ncbi:MAG TPA: protein kinase [Kofleriaceae bacterium]|nr:protein kinase [Kofleriaceae bacterium]
MADSLLGARIGQYEIIRLLGRGGMGEVYLARDLRLGRLVAVKWLTGQHPDLGERFWIEAQATARCHHENIVVIHEVGEHSGRPYMVLEYLEGLTLRQWLRDQAEATGAPVRVSPARAIELVLPVVRALVCAHDQGIVHRDLKPENVMLTRAGVIKVLDFGVAKLVSSASSPGDRGGARPCADSSSLAGTLPYMSPEQTALAVIDQRSDLWAVGVMLFELITGERPVRDGRRAACVDDRGGPMRSAAAHRPEIGSLAQVIDRCLLLDPAHRTASARLLLGELESLAPRRRPAPPTDDGNPFAGLAAFQEADAARFFGRGRDIEHVVAELRARPLVALVGPSGAGKSSLARAGVIPTLKRSGEGWDVAVVRPGRDPLAALAGVVAQIDTATASASGAAAGDGADHAVIAHMRAGPGYLGERLRTHAHSKRRRVVVVVDQLEELYTLGSATDRAAFLACLAAVADDAASPLRVLVCMRSDFLDRLTEDRRMGAELTRGLVVLPPLDRDGMREALLRPVEDSEHRLEPSLVDRMIDAVATTPGALPLLQFTAARLWERRDRDRRMLTEASYEQLGGVEGALATHADTVMAGLSASRQALAQSLLMCLVTSERTRAVVSVTELRALRRDPEQVDHLLQHLTAMRLLVIERASDDGDATVELVHESLIDRWRTLARWLDDHHDDAEMLTRLRVAARHWERSGRAAGLLWTGEVARQARQWRQRHREELSTVEQRYLAAVIAAAERAHRLRRRVFGAALSAAVAAALVMAWLAWQQTQAGERATRAAMHARDATRIAAMRALTADPTAQLALAREIEDVAAAPVEVALEAKRLLHAGVARVVLSTPVDPEMVRFSPDGRWVAVAFPDGVLRMWNADGQGEPRMLRGHGARIDALSFSPDGRRIATASWDNTVRIWNVDGGGDPIILTGHDAPVLGVSFSPDGTRVASASRDRTVRVWSADGRGEPVVLRGHVSFVDAVAFSPDGRRIASGSLDETVRVWSADGRGEPVVLRGHDGEVSSVEFSPDGRHLVSASDDKTIRVWSTDGRGEPVVLRGHTAHVNAASFSPDGRWIVSASYDKTMRLWSADGSGAPRVLPGPGDRVAYVAFDASGGRLVSTSLDRTVRLWDIDRRPSEPLILRGHDGWVSRVVFSPDSQRLASGSSDKTVRVWNADGSGEPLVLRGHDGPVGPVAFSPDGRRIVSGADDRTVRVWNADGSGTPLVLRGHDEDVRGVRFSPDGQRIVSASADRTVRVWNADGSGEPLVLRGHSSLVESAQFSPDGRWIMSAGWDRTVRVWRADGSGSPIVMRGHDDGIRGAMWSPDGRRIVSASADRTVRIWSADGRGGPVVLRGHSDLVFWADFSPDGRHVISASRDGTIRIWPVTGGESTIFARHDYPVVYVGFSPDGRLIASSSSDGTIQVWHDLAPADLADPRLWTATSYCMPVERRVELLGVSTAQAERELARCLERVARGAR